MANEVRRKERERGREVEGRGGAGEKGEWGGIMKGRVEIYAEDKTDVKTSCEQEMEWMTRLCLITQSFLLYSCWLTAQLNQGRCSSLFLSCGNVIIIQNDQILLWKLNCRNKELQRIRNQYHLVVKYNESYEFYIYLHAFFESYEIFSGISTRGNIEWDPQRKYKLLLLNKY